MSTDHSAPQDEVQPAAASTEPSIPEITSQPSADKAQSSEGVDPTPAVEEPANPAPTAPVVEAEKQKILLNPTATPEDVRPVPSIGGEVGVSGPVSSGPIAVPSATDEEIEAEVAKAISGVTEQSAPADYASSESGGPSELPAQESIDISIEAAIREAMEGGAPAGDGSEAGSQEAADPDDLEPGQKLSGVVQSISGDNVFLDFGMRLSGVAALRQFGANPPAPGDTIDVVFDQVNEAEGLMQTRLPGGTMAVVQSSDWDYLSKGQMVECLVKKTNKGGLEVTVGSLRGFIPASQVDIGFVEDMEIFVGKKVTAEITELKPAKKNLVLSRRKVLNARRNDAKKHLLEELKTDQIRTGVVKTIKEYGAFVDLGGTDGFLPISQISWIRIGHPNEVISEGQEIEVKILSIDREKDKISLGMRQLTQNPWKAAESKYEKGSTVTGRVTKTETFGAFVELEPGIEGLIHISELEHRRVKRVTEVLNTGDMVEVQVVEVDPAKKRISLSMKALKAKPEPIEKPEEPEVEKYERKRKGPLKGGTGSTEGRGLFGNPGDFGK